MSPKARYLVLALLAGLWAPLPTSAAEAAPTCQDQPATIVADGEDTVYGTDGPDVIVSIGARHIRAGGGDDVICMPADVEGNLLVDGAAGDDVIVMKGGDRNRIYPGPGDDLVIGGPGQELVAFQYPAYEELPEEDPGTDVVRTGGGSDSVSSLGYAHEIRHQIDLGTGDDHLSFSLLDRMVGEAALVGGPGSDALSVGSYDPTGMSQDVVIDNRQETYALDATEMATWSGFERFGTTGIHLENVTFLGGDADESVSFSGDTATFRIDLGDGDDRVEVYDMGHGGVQVAAGAGRDVLDLRYYARRLELDVAQGTVVAPRDQIGQIAFEAFERYQASFSRRIVMRGGDGADDFVALGNHVVMVGGGGADRLQCLVGPHVEEACHATIRGGPGADRLLGGRGPDVLDGGAGRDFGNGRGGADRCVGLEKRTSCER